MTQPTRRRLPSAERRAVIEEAAGELFGERGYAGIRLDEIAAAANVTKPVLYRHFDSKKALYLALLAAHAEKLPRFVDPAVTDEPLVERLPAILDGWFAYVEVHPYAWKMIFRDTTGDGDVQAFRQAVQDRARAVLVDLLRAQPDLSISRSKLEPAAELLRTGLAGLALWWIDHPEVPRAVLVELATRAIRGLLQPAP
jgi:AcrR family transcriptional regulator